MARNHKAIERRSARSTRASKPGSTLLKNKALPSNGKSKAFRDTANAAVKQQLKQYEEALKYFQQQKFARAKQLLDKVIEGPSKELGDRAQVHLRMCEQKISRLPAAVLKTAEDHYTQGVAMMNLGRWDDARVHLERALKASPKADHIVYAMAALDCLTGEAESAMENL